MNRSNSLIILILVLTVIGVATALGSAYIIKGQILQSLVEKETEFNLDITKQTSILLAKEIGTIEDKVNLLAQFPQVKDGDTATCNKKLAELAPYLKTHIDNITRFNTNLTLDCAISQAAIGYSLTVNPESEIITLIKNPEHIPDLSRSGYSPVTDKYVLYLTVPVFAEDGSYYGIIGGVIYLDYFADKYLESITSNEGSYVALIDDNGDFLYHPNTEYIGKNSNSPDLSGNEPALRSLNAKAVEDGKTGESGTARYSLGGKEMLAVYASAEVFPNRTWTLILTTPVSSITAKIDNNEGFGGLNVSISIAGAVIAIFMLFSALVLFFVIRRINESNALLEEKIKERTQELEKAKLSVEETVKTRTTELQALKNSLEEKVKERTIALEERAEELEERNKFMIDRELKMIELKEENDLLKSKLNKTS